MNDVIAVHDPWAEVIVEATVFRDLAGYSRDAPLETDVDEFGATDGGFTSEWAYEVQHR